jgi:hypothetical protein
VAEAFRGFKKMLYAKYIVKQKTLVFKGAYEKLRQQWPKFVAYKASERAKEMSLKNKANSNKKENHHVLGPGGYKIEVPRWEAMENELRNKGIILGTEGWPERAKHWWYGHEGSLDPTTWECVHRKQTFTPTTKLVNNDVREMTNCELHQPMKNMTFKVASGDALPCLPEALHHGNPIRAGYAHVSVLDIVPGIEDLELDFATPEGDVRLGDVKCQIILWQKKYIMFLGSTPRTLTLRNPSPPFPGECRPPTLPPSHRLRISRRRPRVHLGRHVS